MEIALQKPPSPKAWMGHWNSQPHLIIKGGGGVPGQADQVRRWYINDIDNIFDLLR